MDQCNICNKPIEKTSDDSESKWWEIWKQGRHLLYEIPQGLETVEKLWFPRLVNKYPVEYQKVKTLVSKLRKVEKELVEPIHKKIEEVLWKFFYKKGKMVPHFMYGDGHSNTWDICESCNSELETQIKPYKVDEIEIQRIISKLEEAGSKQLFQGEWWEKIKLSDSEQEEMNKEKEKLAKELSKNKEKELNNKILAERERERERQIWQGCQEPITLLELSVVV